MQELVEKSASHYGSWDFYILWSSGQWVQATSGWTEHSAPLAPQEKTWIVTVTDKAHTKIDNAGAIECPK